jgi:hypothetical protein
MAIEGAYMALIKTLSKFRGPSPFTIDMKNEIAIA